VRGLPRGGTIPFVVAEIGLARGRVKVRRSIVAVVAATVVLLGLGHTPVGATTVPHPPGIGPTMCDGQTGSCTNTIHTRAIVFYADAFTPTPGGPPHPQTWYMGVVTVAQDLDVEKMAGGGDEFAKGEFRVRPYSTGFVSFATFGYGRMVKSDNPAHPYKFEGVEFSHDPDLLRRQPFEFIGEQTGPIPPGEQPPSR